MIDDSAENEEKTAIAKNSRKCADELKIIIADGSKNGASRQEKC